MSHIFGLLGFVINVAVAYWVYMDAGKRGMHQIGWALGSFFCFPIVTIIYLIMRKPAITA
jgi:hypothetical protein